MEITGIEFGVSQAGGAAGLAWHPAVPYNRKFVNKFSRLRASSMHSIDLLLSLGILFLVVAFGRELEAGRWRLALVSCCLLMIAIACTSAFESADHSIRVMGDQIGVVMCGGLALLGLWNPRRLFVAFRIVAILPLFRSLVCASLGASYREELLTIAVISLPGLLFARKARPRPVQKAIHLVLDEPKLPTFERWQNFLCEAGYDLSITGTGDIRKHIGNLPGVFQGRPLVLQFGVISLSQFIAEACLPDKFSNKYGKDAVAATFTYGDQHDRQAAFVAAAALVKLSGVVILDVAHDRWFDADEAIDEAQDIALPCELHVFAHDENLPTSEQWQSALNESGLGVGSWQPFDIREHKGVLPLTVQGIPAGFSFTVSPA